MKKLFKKQKNRGMTYVELIVVLAIFSVMSSIVMFNYSKFQAKVDIKNLSSDIALKVVQAQKLSLSGNLPPAIPQYPINPTWRPSFGVYFKTPIPSTNDTDGIPFNKKFIYFVDLDNTTPPQNGIFEGSGSGCTLECIEQITMTRGDYISRLDVFYTDGTNTTTGPGLNDLAVSFSRPSSGAVLVSNNIKLTNISYVQITISSPNSTTANIKIYPSGRIQIN